MFVTLKLLETSLESVPLAILIVAAIVTGGSAGSMLLCALCPVLYPKGRASRGAGDCA